MPCNFTYMWNLKKKTKREDSTVTEKGWIKEGSLEEQTPSCKRNQSQDVKYHTRNRGSDIVTTCVVMDGNWSYCGDHFIM